MYNANLLENTEVDGANEILKNTTIAVPLKYLSNCRRSLEMPLINCKVEYYVPVATLLARDNQKLSNLLSKGFETSVIGMNMIVIKIRETDLDIFLNQILLESIDYLF